METRPNQSLAHEIEICDTQAHVRVDAELVRTWVRCVLKLENIAVACISVTLVDDVSLHRLNRRFLGHDWPTDVVTFPLNDAAGDGLAGEVVVSTETAAREAAKRGTAPLDELALYVVHGVLHLCGYDDMDEVALLEMRRRERVCLAGLGVVIDADARGEVPCSA